MSAEVPLVKYIGHNVSKVRWQPKPTGTIESSDTFATGSTEEEVGVNWSGVWGAVLLRTVGGYGVYVAL